MPAPAHPVNMARTDARPTTDAAQLLKLAARRLFALHGVDGVTVREIAEAAGQKNHGAVSYYFGSKEALVRELVVDGARLIDDRRNAALDRLEADGGPSTVRQVIDVIIYASVGMEGRDPNDEDSYTRFIVLLGMSHRQLFIEALEQRWNAGYLRCLDHLRRLMPAMPMAAKNQRFVFIGAYLGAVLALREAALTDGAPHVTWRSPATLEHFAQTMAAIIDAPFVSGLGGEGEALRIVGPMGVGVG